VDNAGITLNTLQQRQQVIERDADDQKRQAETQGINGQEISALPGGSLRCSEGQDTAEDRADAGRPAKRESRADNQRAQVSGLAARGYFQTLLEVEEGNVMGGKEKGAEGDKQTAGYLFQHVVVRVNSVASQADDGAQKDEHQREADDKAEGMKEDRPAHAAPVEEFRSIEAGEVDRNHRQNAGREEGKQPAGKGSNQRNVIIHWLQFSMKGEREARVGNKRMGGGVKPYMDSQSS
jgi:hypothetical protein